MEHSSTSKVQNAQQSKNAQHAKVYCNIKTIKNVKWDKLITVKSYLNFVNNRHQLSDSNDKRLRANRLNRKEMSCRHSSPIVLSCRWCPTVWSDAWVGRATVSRPSTLSLPTPSPNQPLGTYSMLLQSDIAVNYWWITVIYCANYRKVLQCRGGGSCHLCPVPTPSPANKFVQVNYAILVQ